MLDDAGNEEMLGTLSVSNRDSVYLMFDTNRVFEVKVANHWIQVDQTFGFARLAPGQKASVLLLLPAGADACRLRLSYQTEIWKQRFVQAIGLRGRILVAKSSILCKLVWPDELRTMPMPPHWKQTTLEVVLPERRSRKPSWKTTVFLIKNTFTLIVLRVATNSFPKINKSRYNLLNTLSKITQCME